MGQSARRSRNDRERATSYITLAADHLVAVELAGQGLERGLNDATAEAKDQVERRLLYSRTRLASAPR